MPLFYFLLKAGRKTFPDTDGQEFEDEEDARGHARAVARELMRNREARTGHWRVQVCDDYLQPRYECLFADVDQTLEMFGADLRVSVIAAARTTAAMGDAYREIDATMADLRRTLSRMDSLLSKSPGTLH
jgi:hypothetical protein